MNIRYMTLDDYDAIYEMWLNTPGMGLNNLDDTREGITRFIVRNSSTCFVATDEGEVVGVIMAGNDGRRGYIYHTTVRVDYRKQGIGKQLVDVTLEALADLGIIKVALVVFKGNDEGNAFWEKMGFSLRDDLYYRNKDLIQHNRIDT